MDNYLFLPPLPTHLDGNENYRFSANADFWRLHLDNGHYREICVRSSAQADPQVVICGSSTVLTYDSLYADDGQVYHITLRVHIETEGDRKKYYSEIDNHAENLRVNEIQLPFFDFDCLAGDREKEVLYIPCSLGERIPNPRRYFQSGHSEYMAADDKDIWNTYDYGGSLTMSFYGVQSGDTFLYLVRKDPEFSICTFCIGTPPRNCDPSLRLTVSHYPFAATGECVITPPVEAVIYHGDWRLAAADYRRWTESWAPMPTKPQWVKEMTGWQRIIMKHQYGEIFLQYKDIPRLWQEGAQYGITTILLFGWWKGCFDKGYPVYEPDEDMGGAEELRKAIKMVNDQGGHVILYANGRLIDVKSDFSKQYGHDVSQIDIDGNKYIERYQFAA